MMRPIAVLAIHFCALQVLHGQIRTHQDRGLFPGPAIKKECTSFHAGCQSSWDLYLTGDHGDNSIVYHNPGLYQSSLRRFFEDRSSEPPIDLTLRLYDTITFSPWMKEDHPQLTVMVFLFYACYILPLNISKGNELFHRSQLVYDRLPRAAKQALEAWSYHQARRYFYEVSSSIRSFPSKFSSVEFVIAFCRERLDWLFSIDMPWAHIHIIEVCNAPGKHSYIPKGVDDVHPGWLTKARKLFSFVRSTKVLKDTSRESLAYAQHIFDQYESIADVTIFLQGNPWDHIDIFQLRQVLQSLRTGSYGTSFLHLGEHYEMAVVDQCMNNMYRIMFNTTCDVCRWGCQTMPCSGCNARNLNKTHCFDQMIAFIDADHSQGVCSNAHACTIGTMKAFASYANNMFVVRKDAIIRKPKHWWGLIYDLLGERTLEASQFGCLALRDRPIKQGSTGNSGHGSGTLAITFEWLWHVVFGERLIMPERSRNSELPLFLRGPDTNRFQSNLPTDSKRLQTRYESVLKHLFTNAHFRQASQIVAESGRVSASTMISSVGCFDNVHKKANVCNCSELTEGTCISYGSRGSADDYVGELSQAAGLISAYSIGLPLDARHLLRDACCSRAEIIFFPDLVKTGLESTHPCFSPEHHAWEVAHAPFMYNRTIQMVEIGTSHFQTLTMFDLMLSPMLANLIDSRIDVEMQLPNHAFVIDVGAGIGLFALQIAILHPTSTILAIEPNPGLFRQLTMNIHRNGLTHQIFPVNIALCNSGRIAMSFDPFWWRSHQPFAGILDEESLEVDVDCMSLPDAFSFAALVWQRWQSGRSPFPSEISLLHVDCDGCEYSFLSRSRSQNGKMLETITERVQQWSGSVSDRVLIDGEWLTWQDAVSTEHILAQDRLDVMDCLCSKPSELPGCDVNQSRKVA